MTLSEKVEKEVRLSPVPVTRSTIWYVTHVSLDSQIHSIFERYNQQKRNNAQDKVSKNQ